MVTLVNRAKMSTSTTGTGTITLGSASSGYQSFADAGVADGDVVRYVVEDGTAWEVGYGTYTASGTTLTRNVMESSNSDAAINLSGSATVFVGAAAEDVPNGTPATAVTPSSGTYTLNLAENTVFYPSGGDANTFTLALSNVPASAAFSGRFEFSFTGQTITWPSSFQWENSLAPSVYPARDYVVNFSISTDDNTKLKAKLDGPYAYTGAVTFPEFVGGAEGTAINGGNVTLDLTALTGGSASSASQNDVVVVLGGQAAGTNGVAPTMASSGWTQIATGIANDIRASGATAWYKVMGATPDTSVQVNGNANANNSVTALAFVFSSVDTTTPIDATAVVNAVSDTVIPSFSAITSSANDRGLVIIGAAIGANNEGARYYVDNNAVYEYVIGVGANDTNDCASGMGYLRAYGQSASYTPYGYTLNAGADDVSYSNVAISILLRGA